MVDVRSLVRIFERGVLAKFFFELLYFSLLILLDGFALVVFSRSNGVFIMLAIEATTSLAGAIVVIDSTRRLAASARRSIRSGAYPAPEFRDLAGCLLAGILIVIPGLATSAVGVLLFMPGVRSLVGRALTRRIEPELLQVYQHLKLMEFEDKDRTENVELEISHAVHDQKKAVVQIDESTENPPRPPEQFG